MSISLCKEYMGQTIGYDLSAESGSSERGQKIADRINNAFRSVDLHDSEFTSRGDIKSFGRALESMNEKFFATTDPLEGPFSETLTKILTYLKDTRKSKQPAPHSAMQGPSAARVTLTKPKPPSKDQRVTAQVSWAQKLAARGGVRFSESDLEELRIFAGSFGEERFQFMVEDKIKEKQATVSLSEETVPARSAKPESNPFPQIKGTRKEQVAALITWAQQEAGDKGYIFSESDIKALKRQATSQPKEMFKLMVQQMVLILQHEET